MNFTEMASFVNHWESNNCMEQKMAWLYGYYSEDPNFPEGVRVNIEAVYEPPQMGEINGVEALDDPL
jgi:nuclear protein localization family protein 4